MKKLDLYIGIKFLKAFVLGLLAFLIIFILYLHANNLTEQNEVF